MTAKEIERVRAWMESISEKAMGDRWPISPEELALEFSRVRADEREACAKIADFWASDGGLSPLHGDANRFGQKVAANGIRQAIRARKD